MSLGDRIPDLHSHDELFIILSHLNVHDKLKGTADTGSKLPNRYHWQRNPSGLLQGTTRTFLNTLEAAKHGATNTVSWLWNTATSTAQEYWNPGSTSSSAEESDAPAAIDPNPQLLADAAANTKYINKEIKAVRSDLAACAAFIGECDDINELKVLLHDLENLQTEMKCGATGLMNLTQTYREERDSYKTLLLRSGSKYEGAVQRLEKADTNLQEARVAISDLINKLKGKIDEKQGGNPLQRPNAEAAHRAGLSTGEHSPLLGSSSFSQAFAGSELPDDFPQRLTEDPNNMLVAIGSYLSNPILADQPDERRLTCGINGELFLYAHEQGAPDNPGVDVQNFIQLLTDTYGAEARNILVENLRVTDGSYLSWGGVKSVLAALPLLVTADVVPNFKGTEKCLSVLSKEDRDRVREAPGKHRALIQYALSNIPDGQGNVQEIRQVFQREFKAQVALLEADQLRRRKSATLSHSRLESRAPSPAHQASFSAQAAQEAPAQAQGAPAAPVLGPPPPPPPPAPPAPPPPPAMDRSARKPVEASRASSSSEAAPPVEEKTPEQKHVEIETRKLIRNEQQRLDPYNAFKNPVSTKFRLPNDQQVKSSVAKMTNEELWVVACGLRSILSNGGEILDDVNSDVVVSFLDKPESEFSEWERGRFTNNTSRWREFMAASDGNKMLFLTELTRRINMRSPGPSYEIPPFNPNAAPRKALKVGKAGGGNELEDAVKKRKKAMKSGSVSVEAVEERIAEPKRERVSKPRSSGSAQGDLLEEIRRRGRESGRSEE